MSTGHWHETYPSGQYCSEVDLRFAQDGQDYIDSLLRLRPSDILYSQDSIKRQFTDGKTLEFSFEQLLNDELTEEDIEPIEVVEDKDGLCWALNGHRRLFLYKMLERFHVVDTIPVKVLDLRDNATRRLFQDRKTTDTNGTSIKVRKRPQMERALEKLGKEFTERRRRERTNNNVVSEMVQSDVKIVDSIEYH
jgi:hypothetical protein